MFDNNVQYEITLTNNGGVDYREWQCMECGTLHDRDVNSALNILALGHERLAGGIPVL